MKRKKISATATALAITAAIIATSIPMYALVDETQNTEVDTIAQTDVKFSQASTFSVTIPKTVTLGTDKTASYVVDVNGDIDSLEYVSVVPDETITMVDSAGGKEDVIGTITQDKTEWAYNEMDTNGTGGISATDLTAGTWNGSFNFNIALESAKKVVTIDSGEAGLYNDEGVMTASWDELLDSGQIYEISNYTWLKGTFKGTLVIKEGTFFGCAPFEKAEVTDVVFPEGFNIDEGFFFNKSIVNVTLPDSFNCQWDRAFKNCATLKSITYKGIKYTSKSALIDALSEYLQNYDILSENPFDGTGLTN